MLDKEAITRFVRDSLGCQCPAEVFKQIETASDIEVGGISLLARIIVGGRLLIYLAEMGSNHQIDSSLKKLIREGTHERDTKGFNRFRLVIVSEKMDAGKILMKNFETEKMGDEKVHLHIISHNDPHFQKLIILKKE